MCVVCIVDKERPTPEQVDRMWGDNPAGAGIAWREGGYVRWRKGLNLPEIQEAIASAPLQFVAHFRIPSSGGGSNVLTHPFPIDKEVPLALEGKTKGFVLFHNGTWSRWKECTMEAAARFKTKIPSGKWSDTRGMAWMAHHYGLGVLELIEEKCVAFGPNDFEIVKGVSGWTRVDGFWVSNTFWERSVGRGNHRGNNAYSTHGQSTAGSAGYHTSAPHSMSGGQIAQGAIVIDDSDEAEAEAKASVGAGGHRAAAPFQQQAPKDLSQAMTWLEEKKISKKQFKKFRNSFEVAARKAKGMKRRKGKGWTVKAPASKTPGSPTLH